MIEPKEQLGGGFRPSQCVEPEPAPTVVETPAPTPPAEEAPATEPKK